MAGVGIVRCIGLQIPAADVAIVGLSEPVDHGGVGLQLHSFLQPAAEHARDLPALFVQRSFFLDNPRKHLNSFTYRDREKLTQYWTYTYLPGKRLIGTDLYVLTSQNTFSAAEEFAYNLKSMERATIVGETTGGGGHDNQAITHRPLNESVKHFLSTEPARLASSRSAAPLNPPA